MIRPLLALERLSFDEKEGQVSYRAFLTDYTVVDRIINHLKLVFVASKPPPPRAASQELLMAAKAGGEYFS